MSDFLGRVQELLRERSEGVAEVAHTNIQLGKLLHEKYRGGSEEKLPALASALTRKGYPVPPDFLSQVYRVYEAIGGEEGFERLRARRRRVSWSGLVREFSVPPAGNSREAVSFWTAFMKEIENTQERVDVLIEHYHGLPYELKPQAEGLIVSMGYSINAFPFDPSKTLEVRSRAYKGSRRKLRVLHVADEHFRDKDLEEIKKSADFIVQKARRLMPHLIVSAGDLLDERQFYDTPAFREAVAFIKALADISPVFLLQGTSDHDGYTVEVFSSIGARNPVCVMDGAGYVGFREGKFTGAGDPDIGEIDSFDALIYAIPPLSKADLVARTRPLESLREVFTVWSDLSAAAGNAGVPVILAGHLAVKGSVASTGQQLPGKAIELGLGDLRLSGADLMLLGHIHKMQYWDDIFYSGSITRLNYGEEEDKGFWVHDFSRDGLISRFVEIPTRPRMTFEFAARPDLSYLPETLAGGLVRIKYRIGQEEFASVDEQAIERALRLRGAAEVKFERSVIPQQRVRAAGISQARTIGEKLKRYAEINGLDLTEGILSKLGTLELEEEAETPAVFSDN
ncbi:MAG TPA: metallophosphoesterase [Dissulfurispiraceae bacterium]